MKRAIPYSSRPVLALAGAALAQIDRPLRNTHRRPISKGHTSAPALRAYERALSGARCDPMSWPTVG